MGWHNGYGWQKARNAKFDPFPQSGMQPAQPEDLLCPTCGEDALYCSIATDCPGRKLAELAELATERAGERG